MIQGARQGRDLHRATMASRDAQGTETPFTLTDRQHVRIALAARANLRNVNLQGWTYAISICGRGSERSESDRSKAQRVQAPGAKLTGANLTNATLNDAILDDKSDLSGAIVTGADKRGIRGAKEWNNIQRVVGEWKPAREQSDEVPEVHEPDWLLHNY